MREQRDRDRRNERQEQRAPRKQAVHVDLKP